MSYQLYRATTIGNALQESLDELILSGQITCQQASKVMLRFDKSISRAFGTRVRAYISFKAGKLTSYRFCDNVWSFVLKDVEFRGIAEDSTFHAVKIVACDGKGMESDDTK
ncbi:transcription initiation factor IIA subunit 2-like [Microplitis demolitor]|uniref:transcription initiation factor IIA subunit 2-like n=1 Tax=Microplitis demolitor TaxID=69319 RepID=UPI00235B6F94|nr:transcription initiation factor IIA subunit 2-like [Microplitis demolitor]